MPLRFPKCELAERRERFGETRRRFDGMNGQWKARKYDNCEEDCDLGRKFLVCGLGRSGGFLKREGELQIRFGGHRSVGKIWFAFLRDLI